MLPAPQVVSLLPVSSGGGYSVIVPSGRNRERGGCLMTLTEVIALLGLLGGAIFVTFQISWTIFKEIHNNKK